MTERTPSDGSLQPGRPAEAGVEERQTGVSRTEGAHLLANEARSHLEPRGFRYDEILAWAETYVAGEGSGDLAAFLQWVEDRESTAEA